jgi:hypothetical protein
MRTTSLLFVLALAGCAAMDTSSVVTATPKSFPYPGTYTGNVMNGTQSYKINADGTGVACLRNKFGGHLITGNVKYDGANLYTEDGTLTVDSVDREQLKVHALFVSADMRSTAQPSPECQEFFAKH